VPVETYVVGTMPPLKRPSDTVGVKQAQMGEEEGKPSKTAEPAGPVQGVCAFLFALCQNRIPLAALVHVR